MLVPFGRVTLCPQINIQVSLLLSVLFVLFFVCFSDIAWLQIQCAEHNDPHKSPANPKYVGQKQKWTSTSIAMVLVVEFSSLVNHYILTVPLMINNKNWNLGKLWFPILPCHDIFWAAVWFGNIFKRNFLLLLLSCFSSLFVASSQ